MWAATIVMCVVTAASPDPLDVTFKGCNQATGSAIHEDLKACVTALKTAELFINKPAMDAIRAAKEFPYTYHGPVILRGSCAKATDS